MLLALWILIALLIIASLLPFSLHVKGVRGTDFSYQAAFHWPWQALGIGLRRDMQGRYLQLLFGNRCLYERKRRERTRKERKKKEKKKGGFSLLKDRKLLSQLIRAVMWFLKDMLSCFRRPRLAGEVEIGFGDPAAMGVIAGFVYAVSPTGMMLDDLRIKPNYVDAILIGEADFSTGARPVRIVIVLVKSIFYFPILGLLRLSRRRKKTARKKEVNENGL